MATSTPVERTDDESADPVVRIQNASVTYDGGESFVLDHVTMDIERHEILGIVGESGSGKSMLASSLLDAIPDPGRLRGSIEYYPEDGEPIDVLSQSKEELRQMRWEEISMVFQGAMSSFNPTMRVGEHFEETLEAHDADVESGLEFARQLLEDLYLEPERVLNSYPHELSGGMQQRAQIALSLVLKPEVLVMDEPTAALDLLMQRTILQLLRDLREKYDLTLVFITHDLPLVATLADRLGVVYAFEPIEVGTTEQMIQNAAHPYTRELLKSTPNLDAPLEAMRPIEGSQPAPVNVPDGCAYHPRCPLADHQCEMEDPGFHEVDETHRSACFHWEASRDEIPLNYADDLGEAARSGGEE